MLKHPAQLVSFTILGLDYRREIDNFKEKGKRFKRDNELKDKKYHEGYR